MLAPVHQIDQIIQDFLIRLITTDVDWEAQPAADIWSKKEILGHLVDSANNNLNRFVRCTYEQNFKLVYSQNDWWRHNIIRILKWMTCSFYGGYLTSR